jgi:hypothetical protein
VFAAKLETDTLAATAVVFCVVVGDTAGNVAPLGELKVGSRQLVKMVVETQ